ncbi:uncharacterized protein LOC143911478 [Arctopsyche grandis]|uniref:uncharacterized protein LOC143911478 n=1 Tax=Arctopsyche grandis TaxID=121162 RepID=UPI00406D887B
MSSAENEEIEASTSKSHKGRNPTRDVEPIRDRSSSRIHQTRSQTQSIEILAKENKVEVIMTSIELRYSGAVQRLKGKIDKSSELDEGQYQTIKEAYDYVRKLHYEYLDNLTDIPKAAKIDEEYDAITITVKNLKAALDCQSFQDSKLKVEQATIKFARDKLPTLTIPTFQGDPSEWQSFQQAFKNIIGNKTEYSNVTKLQYLHQSLIGPALAAVSGLDISSDNYEITWSILDKQYNLPRLNLKTRINSLCDLKLITKESHIELRDLLNKVTVCIKNIESLGYARENLDPWVTCLVLRKLPFSLLKDWETSLVDREMPPYEKLETFLQNRCNVLQSTASVITVKEFPHNRQRIRRTHVANKNPSSRVNSCAFCRNNHFIGKCDKFKAKSSLERNEFVKSNNMCFKCLNSSHKITNCRSNFNCLRCKQNHHTLLHQDDTFSSNNTGRKSINAHSTHFSQREIILPTVQVDIITSNGTVVKGRTLLDSGSQVNYVTTSFAKKNNFKLEKISQKIVGIANQESSIRHITKVTIRSSTTNYSTKVLCLVLPEITGEIPTVKLDQQLISIPAGIKLSDPLWNKPTPIDLLLGAEICVHAMKAGTIQLGKGMPILKDTEFGWTIVGPYPEVNNAPGKSHIGLSQLDRHIPNFWMIDQVPMVKHQSLEEKRCEEHFQAHTSRDKNGRFCVALPYKNSPVVLGSSLHIAEKRHKTLERRFLANNNLKMEYNKVLEEYINLGHMSECEPPEAHEVHCYLPHHVVVKESSLTTKYRVVFDASAKTTSNISLNNILMVGPSVQSDWLNLFLLKLIELIPQTIFKKWKDCQLSNTVMKLYKIPRLIILNNVINIQAHGFCDASEKAYGACIYVKCTDQLGNSKCHLVCSRSRVAPLSFVTIPRLELCSAMLLSKLMKSTIDQLTIHINEKYYWTDSTVALHWIRGESCKWTTFVANRVAEIQSISQPIEWYHVSSTDNPADLISRGTQPSELNHNSLWWDGPSWLKLDESRWPRRPPEITIDLPERRVVTNATLVRENNWIDKYSHLPRLLRVLSYVRRPLRNKQLNVKENNEPSALELKDALNNLIRLSQMESFPLEYRLLSKGHPIPSSSKLAKLSPLFHENLICVGSRLPLGTTLSTSPIILSNKHKLTHMIVRDAHLKYIHLGTQALLSLLRQTYWPLAGHNTVKGVVRSCVICFRNKPLSHNRLMGLLPLERTTANFPFSHVGIDFAGPFPVKSGCNKNSKIIKGYVCVFVCFSSKAVHLELVGDLTSSNFLNCLRRFVARRGRPNTIYSDNATNFVGASRELVNLVKLIYERPHEEKLLRYVASEGIRWKFNPPRAPHMGGLWEAAVKSMKIHLNKVLKATTLNFESFCTVLTQIEACMNSRPLSPLSSDPLDLLPLTPGHFLIGRSLLALPMEVKYNTNVHANLLQIQLTTAAFWKRWSAEYLHSLQLRNKWKKDSSNNLSVGQMVLLKEEHMLPTRWVLGRVTKSYPGPDGRVRVVDVFTASGEFRRSSHLVAPLPILPQGPLDRKEDQQEGGETAASIPSTSVA